MGVAVKVKDWESPVTKSCHLSKQKSQFYQVTKKNHYAL